MIRLTLLTLYVAGLALYSRRDWYKSLCGLIALMAVIEHPDMPKSILGIQGLNLWNLLLAVIVFAWASNRSSEGLKWDMPSKVTKLLLLYLAIVLLGFVRMWADQKGLIEHALLTGSDMPSTAGLISETLINTLKWVVPGLLLYDGCRSRSRFYWALFALLSIYFLIGIQVIRWMPLSNITSGEALTERSLKILVNEVGYHRVNLSMMLSGASWAIFALQPLAKRWYQLLLVLLGSFTVVFAQSLTGGRAGYATWAVVGLIVCAMRWRKYLVLAPIAALVILSVVPGAAERMSQGFSGGTYDSNALVQDHGNDQAAILGDNELDLYTITAGRNVAWPYVIEKIWESPWIGYGREAMMTTGIATFLLLELGESFPHPHNAYLQLLLDNGFIGFFIIMPFYLMVLKYSGSLFLDSRSPIFIVIGGVTLSLVSALLVASLGSQTFYPREGAVGMWCAIGLMLRVHTERSRSLEPGPNPTIANREATTNWVLSA